MYCRLQNINFFDRPTGSCRVRQLPKIRTRHCRVPTAINCRDTAVPCPRSSCLSATRIDITFELKITVVEPVVYIHPILTS